MPHIKNMAYKNMKRIKCLRGLLMAGLFAMCFVSGHSMYINPVYGEELSFFNEKEIYTEQGIGEIPVEKFIEAEETMTYADDFMTGNTEGMIAEEEIAVEENMIVEGELAAEEDTNMEDHISIEGSMNAEDLFDGGQKDVEEDMEKDAEESIEGNEDVFQNSEAEHQAAFTMSVTEDIREVKAGQQLGYEILLENTGNVDLKFLELRSILDNGNMIGEWMEADGLVADNLAGTATVSLLEAGQAKEYVLMVHIPEDRQSNLDAEFFAKADDLCKAVSLTTEVTPLKIEFEVKKWADRARTFPGDTITYQICIRNTGERSLHSVLTTEKFQEAGLRAEFQEREGVILNGAKTEALIAEIKPGEAYGLYATITLPENFQGSHLLNEVTVVTKETGEEIFHAQAEVDVEEILPTEKPEQIPENPAAITENVTTKEIPKTSDLSETEMWAGAFGISCLIIIAIYWIGKAKRKR